MKVIIIGGDGFCGWPLSLKLSKLGMDITIVTSAGNTEEGKALLVEFGFPFEKK